jgi:hypothetical protein
MSAASKIVSTLFSSIHILQKFSPFQDHKHRDESRCGSLKVADEKPFQAADEHG